MLVFGAKMRAQALRSLPGPRPRDQRGADHGYRDHNYNGCCRHSVSTSLAATRVPATCEISNVPAGEASITMLRTGNRIMLLNDLRYTARTLRRAPAFTAAAILTL